MLEDLQVTARMFPRKMSFLTVSHYNVLIRIVSVILCGGIRSQEFGS